MTGYIIEHLEQTFQICQKVKRGQFVTKEPWKHTNKDMKKVKGEVPNAVNNRRKWRLNAGVFGKTKFQ